MRILIVIATLFTSLSSLSQNRCLIKSGDLFGYIDTLGNVVIEPAYTHAAQFSEDLALVYLDDKVGFIDTLGQIKIPIAFEYASRFECGLAVVGQQGKYGLIDKAGNMVLDYRYDWISSALISEGRVAFKQDDLWGFLNYEGEVEIPNTFDSVHKFGNGMAVVGRNHRYSVIDTNGAYVVEPNHRMIRATDFEDQRIAVRASGSAKFHYIDLESHTITAANFCQASDFDEGFAFVKEEFGEAGYFINRSGEKAFEATYSTGGPFSQGRAVVSVDGKYGIIDSLGNTVVPLEYDGFNSLYLRGFILCLKKGNDGTRFGVIDRHGNIIAEPIYEFAVINDGECPYPELYEKRDGNPRRLSYINARGKVIWAEE